MNRLVNDLEKLHMAAFSLDYKKVKSLLARGVSAKRKVDGCDLLYNACGGSMVLANPELAAAEEAIIRLAVEHGADVNARYAQLSGYTPLILAASGGSAGAARVLCELGADPNLSDEHDFTPLHRAALGGRAGAVAALLECGADPTPKTSTRQTALQLAIEGKAEASGLEGEDYPTTIKLLEQAQKQKGGARKKADGKRAQKG